MKGEMDEEQERRHVQWGGASEEKDVDIAVSRNGLRAHLYMSYLNCVGTDILGTPLARAFNMMRRTTVFLRNNHGEPPFYFRTLLLQRSTCHCFMKAQHYIFKDEFYKYFDGFPRHEGMQRLPTRLYTRHECTDFGRSTYVQRIQMFPDAGQLSTPELLEVRTTGITVDAGTHRPADFKHLMMAGPGEYKTKPTGGGYHTPQLPAKVNHTTSRAMIDRYIDINGHVNYKVYSWMMMECVNEGFRHRKYNNNYDGDILLRRMREFLVVYHSECLLGDMVDVHTWDTVGEPDTVHVQVHRQGELKVHAVIIYMHKPQVEEFTQKEMAGIQSPSRL